MALSKDEYQKIFLSSMLLLGLIYCYFEYLLGPLDKKSKAAKASTVTLQKKTSTASGTAKDYRELLAQSDKAQETLLQIDSMIPSGAAVAWYPPQVKAFMEQNGIPSIAINQAGSSPLEGAPNFRKMSFNMEIESVDAVKFGIAIAGFENAFPLSRISQIDITPAADPMLQKVKLTAVCICKQ